MGSHDLTQSTAPAKGRRPYFFSDPAIDKVLAITIALAGELSVTRDRLDAVERLLAAKAIVTADEIGSWKPDDRAKAERGNSRQDYIARILMVLQHEAEAVPRVQADEQYDALQAQLADSAGFSVEPVK